MFQQFSCFTTPLNAVSSEMNMMAKKLPIETEFVVLENQIWHRPTGARFYLRDGFELIDLLECKSAPRAADNYDVSAVTAMAKKLWRARDTPYGGSGAKFILESAQNGRMRTA